MLGFPTGLTELSNNRVFKDFLLSIINMFLYLLTCLFLKQSVVVP